MTNKSPATSPTATATANGTSKHRSNTSVNSMKNPGVSIQTPVSPTPDEEDLSRLFRMKEVKEVRPSVSQLVSHPSIHLYICISVYLYLPVLLSYFVKFNVVLIPSLSLYCFSLSPPPPSLSWMCPNWLPFSTRCAPAKNPSRTWLISLTWPLLTCGYPPSTLARNSFKSTRQTGRVKHSRGRGGR